MISKLISFILAIFGITYMVNKAKKTITKRKNKSIRETSRENAVSESDSVEENNAQNESEIDEMISQFEDML